MTLEIQFLVWDRRKNVVGLNQLMGSQPSHLHNYLHYILHNYRHYILHNYLHYIVCLCFITMMHINMD